MCWHKWKIKDKVILPSFMEQLNQMQRGLNSAKGTGCAPEDFAKKDCVVTYICDKCGSEKVERV